MILRFEYQVLGIMGTGRHLFSSIDTNHPLTLQHSSPLHTIPSGRDHYHPFFPFTSTLLALLNRCSLSTSIWRTVELDLPEAFRNLSLERDWQSDLMESKGSAARRKIFFPGWNILPRFIKLWPLKEDCSSRLVSSHLDDIMARRSEKKKASRIKVAHPHQV